MLELFSIKSALARRQKVPEMSSLRLILALLFAFLIPEANAATLRVGSQEKIIRIAEAARLAKDGDTVEILPGEYRGDVAVWQQKTCHPRHRLAASADCRWQER